MPLPVSARSFLPNPLTGVRAQESGFKIGQQSSSFANFVTGAFEGASTTLGLIDQAQKIQQRPQEQARKEREQQRRERQTDLGEERFEFESGERFEFEKQKTERGFELQEERINNERTRIAQQASRAAIGRRDAAQVLGVENALVQLEQSNLDPLLAEYQNDPGTTTRRLLENDAGSDKRRDRALSILGGYIRDPNNPRQQVARAEQLFEALNDQAFLMDNLKKTDAAFQLIDSNHYPMERSDSVFLRKGKDIDGNNERLLRVFDRNGREKYVITESEMTNQERTEKDKEAFFGAGRRIEDYQRKQKEVLESPLKQLAAAKARQAGQPAQQERPAKQGPQRRQLQQGDTGVAPAASPAQARRRGGVQARQEPIKGGGNEIASPQFREGEKQLRDIAGVRQRGGKPVLDPETIQSPLF